MTFVNKLLSLFQVGKKELPKFSVSIRFYNVLATTLFSVKLRSNEDSTNSTALGQELVCYDSHFCL